MGIFDLQHPLHSAARKVVRAQVHLDEVWERVRSFADGNCEVNAREQYDPISGCSTIRISLPKPDPEIALIAGDCIFCLRSALEHIVYSLVVSNPPNEPQPCNQFPICSSPELFRLQVDKRKRLIGVGPEGCAAIEGLQPYNCGHNLLGLLDELHRIDKHRALNVTSVRVNDVDFTWSRGGVSHASQSIEGDEVADGAEIIHYRPTEIGLHGEVELRGRATGEVVFEDLYGIPVAPALDEMIQFFKDGVLAECEPLFS